MSEHDRSKDRDLDQELSAADSILLDAIRRMEDTTACTPEGHGAVVTVTKYHTLYTRAMQRDMRDIKGSLRNVRELLMGDQSARAAAPDPQAFRAMIRDELGKTKPAQPSTFLRLGKSFEMGSKSAVAVVVCFVFASVCYFGEKAYSSYAATRSINNVELMRLKDELLTSFEGKIAAAKRDAIMQATQDKKR